MATFIRAIIEGLGALLFGWLRERQAEKDRNTARALEAYVRADADADQTTKEATADAAKAVADAVPDFTTLR